ncbi:unnamed protein product [Eruca vesicaria subsp. sativa]|uniref:Uncharacterized protein n=1 Tax=Eruca vesicaria subsp. sativa TaxID=29727 RepID=A0ABC8LLA3_ERUVS|nr:unnamed protein product [Eruca vesicaria subsp. sativa]
MLFGVRLTEGSVRKSVSMGNLSHGHGSASPGDVSDHVAGDGYASEDIVAGSSSNRERKKGIPWTEEEHRLFLSGLRKLGKGNWRDISRRHVTTRTPTQVASHAQKYFMRQSNVSRKKRRSSVLDMVPDDEGGDIPMVETKMQGGDSVHQTLAHTSVHAPSIFEIEEQESMDSTNFTVKEPTTVTTLVRSQSQPQLRGSFPVQYHSPHYRVGGEPSKKEESHEILRPTAVHSKAPINVEDLFGRTTQLSLGEPKEKGETDLSLSLKLGGGIRDETGGVSPE